MDKGNRYIKIRQALSAIETHARWYENRGGDMEDEYHHLDILLAEVKQLTQVIKTAQRAILIQYCLGFVRRMFGVI